MFHIVMVIMRVLPIVMAMWVLLIVKLEVGVTYCKGYVGGT